ncbi:hypothetical protein SGFS_047990 [Streptomyces graminofaciens]|uniref:Uncharacterized protein n=1 Tax=Streptomyces graminofaciens TaxID=68212 RepID=A0ABM8HKV7_9ACTN|nr:hypothetical protein SGFS_047990 [Streptomyces graminofaciens]
MRVPPGQPLFQAPVLEQPGSRVARRGIGEGYEFPWPVPSDASVPLPVLSVIADIVHVNLVLAVHGELRVHVSA